MMDTWLPTACLSRHPLDLSMEQEPQPPQPLPHRAVQRKQQRKQTTHRLIQARGRVLGGSRLQVHRALSLRCGGPGAQVLVVAGPPGDTCRRGEHRVRRVGGPPGLQVGPVHPQSARHCCSTCAWQAWGGHTGF